MLFLWRRLVANSGGPGQMRGGQSLDQAYAIHYSDKMAGPGFNACAQVPPHGAGGGYPGCAGTFFPVRGSNVADAAGPGRCCRRWSGSRAAPRWCARRSPTWI